MNKHVQSVGADANRPSQKRRKTAWWIGGGAAVIVLAGLAGTANAMDVFASGKQLVLNAVSKNTTTASTNVQEQWNLQFKNLQVPGLSSTDEALLSSLNNSSLGLSVLLDPQAQQAQIGLKTNMESVPRQATVWVTGSKAIVNANRYQSLLAAFLPAGVQIPKYLVTDSSQSSAIAKFWSEVNHSESDINPKSLAAAKQLAALVVQAIPQQYFHRSGLAGVRLTFDQKGFEDILDNEVKAVYANPDQYASLLSQMEGSNLPAGETQAQVKQAIEENLTNTPEEAVLAAIQTALHSGDVTVKQTTIAVQKPLFGTVTEKVTGGIVVHIPQVGASGEMDFTATSAPLTTKISIPSPSPSQSETFNTFAKQLSAAEDGGN
ncbi:hypothetical protein JI721_13260 [Alicyclobacillus cycloheptanicus]|uniref:Uncharacterized protein n=1 Tax=Alicyclobacillus cycloheptanicus TaxID=1457 RepID=A0ABT9XEE8_9BACL|nr:hypothetical protein [Alicyclobacillus cycloheptanicus]MDQ0188669.1 hypothetical protein [Alicyclobacillus cycloheptanicus]WDM00659.1 hypothetical protein JI721_13260 [Alicyclobacillus cycloheptanicus]